MKQREVYSITAPTLTQLLQELGGQNENENLYERNPRITIEQNLAQSLAMGFTAVIEVDVKQEDDEDRDDFHQSQYMEPSGPDDVWGNGVDGWGEYE